LLPFHGLRCAIEGKVDDVPDARKIVLKDVLWRIEAGIAQLVYPKELRSTTFAQLERAIASTPLDFCLITEDSLEAHWQRGDVDTILAELRRAHELLSSDDAVRQAAEELADSLKKVADVFMANEAVCKRLGDLLGMGEPPRDEDTE